jgi:hypothetical protein
LLIACGICVGRHSLETKETKEKIHKPTLR